MNISSSMAIKKYRQLHLSNAAGIRLQEHIVQRRRNDDTSRVTCSNRWTADFEYHVAREGWATVKIITRVWRVAFKLSENILLSCATNSKKKNLSSVLKIVFIISLK